MQNAGEEEKQFKTPAEVARGCVLSKMSTSKRIFQSVTDCWRFEDRPPIEEAREEEREKMALSLSSSPLSPTLTDVR